MSLRSDRHANPVGVWLYVNLAGWLVCRSDAWGREECVGFFQRAIEASDTLVQRQGTHTVRHDEATTASTTQGQYVPSLCSRLVLISCAPIVCLPVCPSGCAVLPFSRV